MAAEQSGPAALRALARDELARRRIAVVGGGLVGTATAWAAALIGGDRVQVDLYEAAQVGHEGGASIDATRVFRHIYGDQAHYSRWTAEALRLWRALEAASGRTLYRQTGGVWIVSASAQEATTTGLERPFSPEQALRLVESSLQTMRAVGLPAELLDGEELHQRYPQFADRAITRALLDPQAGMLFARDAVLALRDVGVGQGARLHEGKRAVALEPSRAGCGVRFADGSSVEADVVVLATNGWTAELLPRLGERMQPRANGAAGWSERGLQNTEQPLFYFTPPPGAAEELAPGRFPVFLFANARVYGLPAHAGAVKVANDDPARRLERPEERRLAGAGYREQLYAFLVRQLPALRGAALMQERVCFYDRSPDGDFVLDQWDADARLLVACGFSGHGFKFGPLLGARLARYALSGARPADLQPFGFGRFQPEAAASR